MLQGSHVSRDPILLLGVSICPMSRLLNVRIKVKKKAPRIVSLVRLCLLTAFLHPKQVQNLDNDYNNNNPAKPMKIQHFSQV